MFKWTFELLCIGFVVYRLLKLLCSHGCTICIVVLNRLKGRVKRLNERTDKIVSQKSLKWLPALLIAIYFYFLFWHTSREVLMACSDSSAKKRSRWHSAGLVIAAVVLGDVSESCRVSLPFFLDAAQLENFIPFTLSHGTVVSLTPELLQHRVQPWPRSSPSSPSTTPG